MDEGENEEGITCQAEGTTRAKFQAKEPEKRKGQEVVWGDSGGGRSRTAEGVGRGQGPGNV